MSRIWVLLNGLRSPFVNHSKFLKVDEVRIFGIHFFSSTVIPLDLPQITYQCFGFTFNNLNYPLTNHLKFPHMCRDHKAISRSRVMMLNKLKNGKLFWFSCSNFSLKALQLEAGHPCHMITLFHLSTSCFLDSFHSFNSYERKQTGCVLVTISFVEKKSLQVLIKIKCLSSQRYKYRRFVFHVSLLSQYNVS